MVRGVAALAAAVVAISVIWWWWISLGFDPTYLPYEALRLGLAILEGMGIVIAVLISPALLAGSLARMRLNHPGQRVLRWGVAATV